MLAEIELQKFPVLPISPAKTVAWVRVGCVVLFFRQQLADRALLKFYVIGFGEMGGDFDHLAGDHHLSLVVTSDFGDDLREVHLIITSTARTDFGLQ